MKISTKKPIAALTLAMIASGCSFSKDKLIEHSLDDATAARIETFTFLSNGRSEKGKVYLPAAYESRMDLPAIFLIDYTEQQFELATDEFQIVVDGMQRIQGLEALVVSLEYIPDIDAEPENFNEHYDLFMEMASYVADEYTSTSSRTLIGKGSESGIVLMTLFAEDPESSLFDSFIVTDPSPLYASAVIEMVENRDFPGNKSNKKLHFSFSTTNDRTRCKRLIDLIDDAHFPWLEFESIEYTNSDYENTYPIAYAAGMSFVFEGTE